jgi:O-antigen ligase
MLKTVIALSIAAALCWFAVPVVQQRLTPLVNWQTDVSAKVRLLLWRESILIFEKSPIFGVGIRQFPHFRIPEALGQGHVAIDHAHSNYLHILATTGIVGILSYVYLWISVLSLSLTNWKESNKDRLTPSADSAIYFGILAGAIALIVSGIFEYNFGTAQIRLTQWFLFAMLLPRRHVPDYKQK